MFDSATPYCVPGRTKERRPTVQRKQTKPYKAQPARQAARKTRPPPNATLPSRPRGRPVLLPAADSMARRWHNRATGCGHICASGAQCPPRGKEAHVLLKPNPQEAGAQKRQRREPRRQEGEEQPRVPGSAGRCGPCERGPPGQMYQRKYTPLSLWLKLPYRMWPIR